MTRLLLWWMGCPMDIRYAAVGVISPYILLGLTYWLTH